MLHRIIHPIDPMGWCVATQKDKAPWSQSFACVWPRCYTLIVTTIKTWANCCILVDRAFLLKWPSSSGLRAVHSFEKMDAVPSELQPPQLIYIMLMCLRALALQAGVFVSPADISWEQANPNGTNGPVGCTIGDGSNLGSALQCIEVSDSDSDPKEKKSESASGKAHVPKKDDGPREPPYPPPRRRKQRSSSSSCDHPWKKKGKK